MDVVEAINNRRSIRSFKPDPVPLDILRKIVDGALRAPSASNSQPWEFAIVGGAKLDEIKRAYIENADKPLVRDLPGTLQYPEPWVSRRRTLMSSLLEKAGIAREDKQKRTQFNLSGYELWGAPNAIYVIIDKDIYLIDNAINVWPIFDCGLIAQNILLLATEYGLGSIPAIQPVLYPDILRKILDLPDSKLMVLVIAIGYPDWDNPVNQFRSEREPLDKVARFYTLP